MNSEAGTYALIIAIIGCGIKDCDLKEAESPDIRRYPATAEDAFKCFEGRQFESIMIDPSCFADEKYRYISKDAYIYKDGNYSYMVSM